MDASTDVQTKLQAAGLGTAGTNLFRGPVRPVGTAAQGKTPANSIFVLSSGGREGDRVHFMNSENGPGELRYPNVQVRVRNTGFDAGKSIAEQVYQALEGQLIAGYWDIRALQSEPVYIRQDENNNYHWSLNFELRY